MSDKRKQVLSVLLEQMEARDTTGGSKLKKEQRADKVSQMEAIISKAQKDNSRSLTKDEAGQWEQLYSEVKDLSKELEAEQEKEEREVFNIIKNFNKSNEVQETEWRDKQGNEVKVYRSNERLSDSLNPEERELSIGKAVQAMVTSDWSQAENERRALDTVGNASITVPKVLSSRIWDKARAQSVMSAAGIMTVPMTSSNMTLVKVSSDPDNIHFKAENAPFANSAVQFSPIELKSYTLGTVIPISRELASDSPMAAAAIENALAGALASQIDYTALFGTGVAQPKGLDLYTDLQNISVGGALSSYDYFVNAWAMVLEKNVEPNAYIINPRTAASLETLVAQSTGDYMKQPAALQNLQRLISSRLPYNLGTGTNESAAYLGAFKDNVVLGLRSDLLLEVSTEAGEAFQNHQVLIKMTTRFDVAVVHPERIVKLSGIIA
jgi:HK97 family phage major capsid protein